MTSTFRPLTERAPYCERWAPRVGHVAQCSVVCCDSLQAGTRLACMQASNETNTAPCYACERPVRITARTKWLHVMEGAADLGYHPVGNDCAKALIAAGEHVTTLVVA